MSWLRELSQEGSEKVIIWSVLLALLSFVAIRLLWGLIKFIFTAFGVTLPVMNLAGPFVLFIIIAIPLMGLMFAMGDIRQKGIVGVVILAFAVGLLLLVGFYAPKLFPDAFQAALLNMKVATQSIIPIP